MSKYEVRFWEKQSVWVYHTVRLDSDKKPTAKNFKEILESSNTDYMDSDYNWESMNNMEYDFKDDFQVEKIG